MDAAAPETGKEPVIAADAGETPVAKRLLLLGPQGSGKGTQADLLAAATGVPHISTGELVRGEIAAGSDLGRTLRRYNDRGLLVPDDIIVAMTLPRLLDGGWILDGFPRTLEQAAALDDALNRAGLHLDHAIALEMDDTALITRLSGRRLSAATGRTYHLVDNPPPPDDPGPFLQRADDTPARIAQRLALYHEETAPLIAYYERQGLLARVNADAPIASVTAAILRALHLSR